MGCLLFVVGDMFLGFLMPATGTVEGALVIGGLVALNYIRGGVCRDSAQARTEPARQHDLRLTSAAARIILGDRLVDPLHHQRHRLFPLL